MHTPPDRLRFIVRLCFVLALGMAAPTGAAAGKFSDFMAASKQALDHNRSADFYLRTGNIGVAVFELQAMADIWTQARARFDENPPEPFAEDPEWQASLASISDGITAAAAQSREGDAKTARETVQRIRTMFSELRRRNGITVYADCVAELNAAIDSIWRFRRAPPDLTVAAEVDTFKAHVAVIDYLVRKCRDRAPQTYRDDEMFDRLFSQSLEAIGRFDGALRDRNSRLLIDTLRELRSFDRMIFLRYG